MRGHGARGSRWATWSEVEPEQPEPPPEPSAWVPRRGAALLLKIAVVVLPLVTSVVVSMLVAGVLPVPATFGGQVLWWGAVLASSALVLIAGEALARRLLPLVSLWRLSLLFPGRAPSRMMIAGRSSRRELERLSEAVRTQGLGADAEQAAVTLVRLVAALDAHDRRTRGHSERVRVYTDLLAQRLHLDADDTNKLRWAALLHDIGKLAVPAEVLNKPGRLNAAEWALIHEHPAEGHRMLGALRDWLGPWALVVLEHHERWDGTGYPNQVAGSDISIGARLVSVADCYDVMTSVRSYQPYPRTPEGARGELVRCSGTQFDPGMVRCFLNISTRRLWWLLGPATWVVQVPVVGRAAIAAIKRPVPRLADLSRVAIAGLAVTLTMPGLSGTDRDPADAAADALPVSVARHSVARPLGPVVRHRPQVRAADRATAAGAAASPASAVAAPGPTSGGPAEAAAKADAASPSRHPAPLVGPVKPSAKPAAKPVTPWPARPAGRPAAPAPPSSASAAPVHAGPAAGAPSGGTAGGVQVQGHGYGYGHEKGKGKGHAHHDADGDGVDDKAGSARAG